MDLIAAARVFVSVADRNSFTQGAALEGIPQPVASRRIASLEEHLDGQLIDRSTRHAFLTPFGREILPLARRLVDTAAVLDHAARHHREGPHRLVLPEHCLTADLVLLGRAAKSLEITFAFDVAPPAERSAMLSARDGWSAVVPVAPSQSVWTVSLGLAHRGQAPGTVYIESLRTRRGQPRTSRTRIWLDHEDDVPHIRDRLKRLADSTGLAPGQIVITDTATGAVEASANDDFLLCSRRQAKDLNLSWSDIGDVRLVRGYAVDGQSADIIAHLTGPLGQLVGRCLGVEADAAATP